MSNVYLHWYHYLTDVVLIQMIDQAETFINYFWTCSKILLVSLLLWMMDLSTTNDQAKEVCIFSKKVMKLFFWSPVVGTKWPPGWRIMSGVWKYFNSSSLISLSITLSRHCVRMNCLVSYKPVRVSNNMQCWNFNCSACMQHVFKQFLMILRSRHKPSHQHTKS